MPSGSLHWAWWRNEWNIWLVLGTSFRCPVSDFFRSPGRLALFIFPWQYLPFSSWRSLNSTCSTSHAVLAVLAVLPLCITLHNVMNFHVLCQPFYISSVVFYTCVVVSVCTWANSSLLVLNGRVYTVVECDGFCWVPVMYVCELSFDAVGGGRFC